MDVPAHEREVPPQRVERHLGDGDGGNDWIDGGASPDDIYGGTGDDTLDGGLHNDSLRGEGGRDTCTSGEIRMSSCEIS